MDELHAFIDDELVGTFVRSKVGTITFEYSTAAGTPLSLSLPRDSPHTPEAAGSYLDNLLPDNIDVRKRWARDKSLPDATPFTLMSAYGEDVAGAVSLSPDPNLPRREPETLIEASEDDIAERIAALRYTPSSWVDPRTNPRMSLAGMQGKFTLTQIGRRWFWPTYESPSTHILKPPSQELRSIERFESASLDLARSVGIQASTSSASSFLDQSTFIVERWDRAPGLRLPAEDLNQALGYATGDKYKVTAPEVARLLDRYGQARNFVRQLAFNVSIGNADAHAKNYSVLMAGDQVELAPLYDSVPVFFWPKFNQRYAMPIGTAELPVDLHERNWKLFAKESGLDGDMVCEEAFTVMQGVEERFWSTFEHAGADQDRLSKIEKYLRKVRRALPSDFRSSSPVLPARTAALGRPVADTDTVWVEAYTRKDGVKVERHARKRPTK